MDNRQILTVDERIIQVLFDRHAIQFSLDGGGVVVAEGVIEIRTLTGNSVIDVKSANRDLNPLSSLLEKRVEFLTYNNSSVELKFNEELLVLITTSGRHGEAGLIRIKDRTIVIA